MRVSVSLRFAVVILIISLGMTSFTLGVSPPVSADEAQRYLLLASGSLPANLDALVASVGGRLVEAYDQIGVAVVASNDPAFAYAAGSLTGVQAVVPDAVTSVGMTVDTEGLTAEAVFTEAAAEAGTSGPAINPVQWNLAVLQAKQAWSLGYLGAGATVAVLDSGIDAGHPGLNGQVIASLSKSYVNEFTTPGTNDALLDKSMHGTHVAGIIAAKSGFPGVAPQAKLISVKVLKWNPATRAAEGKESDIIGGILYAADHGANVINISAGFTFAVNGREAAQQLAALNRAVNYAFGRGVLVVASVGNGGSDLDRNRNEVKAPAQITHVVAASATGPLYGQNPDQIAWYSDYGSSAVYVAGPGGNLALDATGKILLTPATDMVLSVCSRQAALAPKCAKKPMGVFMAGTSQAAAHVSGVAALVVGKFGGAVSPATLRTILKQSAEDLGKPGRDEKYGFGRINALRAVTVSP